MFTRDCVSSVTSDLSNFNLLHFKEFSKNHYESIFQFRNYLYRVELNQTL